MRYMTETEYLSLRERGHIRGYRDRNDISRPLLRITLPEPGGAFILEPVTVVTEPVPTKLVSYGRIYACNPEEWAREHRHPAYEVA